MEEPLATVLADAVELGNGTIGFVASCRPELRGMSTTLTAVALSGDGEYVVANVDDSRTYLFRDGALEPLTRDESLVQELLDSGAITEAEARAHPQRSVVLRALDGEDGRRTAITRREARPGDRLLLCSDGLSDALDDAAIAAALGEPSREECAERLVRLALDAGARDNVSVVVADVVPRTDPAGGWRG